MFFCLSASFLSAKVIIALFCRTNEKQKIDLSNIDVTLDEHDVFLLALKWKKNNIFPPSRLRIY